MNHMKRLLVWLLLTTLVCQIEAQRIEDLRCEGLHQPWGISQTTPALSWKINLDHQGVRQMAYQILAATSPALLKEETADLWNSGRVESAQSQWIRYAGTPLSSRSVVYWQARIWDERGKASDWARGAHFSVGILDTSLWKGKYIGMERQDRKVQPMLRRIFTCSRKTGEVFLHVSTLGYHEIYLNGKPVSDDVLSPAVVEFSKRHQSMTYNVTDLLKEGENDLVIWLGGGWYNNPDHPGVQPGGPYVLAQVDMQHGKAWSTLVATDHTWKARPSGYYDDGVSAPYQFGGEVVKAWEVLPDLERPTLDAAQWQGVVQLPVQPFQQISPMMCESNKIQQIVAAKQISRFRDDEWMVDMGRSIVGWTRIRLGKLQKGQRITITYGDMLGQDGDFDLNTYTDYYMARGEGEEVFCNKFNYHAYRYLKIRGLGRPPLLSDVEGLNIHTDYRGESSFVCSDADLNAIHDMVHYTFQCLTLGGYMVDCPHHERQGYGGDGNASILAAQLQYDLYPLYRNWLQAYADVQGEDGEVSHTAPNPWSCGGGPYWCAFMVNAPWQTYLQYGDTRLLSSYYPHMQRYITYAERHMPQGMLSLEHRWGDSQRKGWFLGDWALPNEEHQQHTESIDLVNNCSMSWVYGIMSRVAAALGKTGDQQMYEQKQIGINERIHSAFYRSQDSIYANALQLDMAFPLYVHATPRHLSAVVHRSLCRLIDQRYDGHLYTGLVGVPILTQWLTQVGESQMMYDMLKQRSFPGYLYMIENGATTTWEHWTSRRSRIHNCYNGIGSWFYQALGGIVLDEAHPAYQHFYVRPQLVDGISFARTLQSTPYGNIVVDWKLSSQAFDLRLTIPAGTTATVVCPFGLDPVSVEMPSPNHVRYGLMYSPQHRDKVPAVPTVQYDSSQPLVLESGSHRIVYHLK